MGTAWRGCRCMANLQIQQVRSAVTISAPGLDSPPGWRQRSGSTRPSRKVSAMKGEPPTFVEINMSAEIGGYQSDFEQHDPVGPAAPRGGEDQEADAGA